MITHRRGVVFKEGCAMRRSIPPLLILAFLQACAAKPRATEAPPEPPPEKVTPATAAAPVWKVDSGLEKTYKSSLPLCVDGALKVCRERDYRVKSQAQNTQGATLSAQGRSFEFTLAFAR